MASARTMGRRLGAGVSLIAVLALAACTSDGDDAPSPSASPTPTASATSAPAPPPTGDGIEAQAAAWQAQWAESLLEYTLVDPALAEEAAQIDASVYIAAPMFVTGPQRLFEMSPILEPRGEADVSGSALAALSTTDQAVYGMSRDCLNDTEGFAFCSKVATIGPDGAEVDEATADLGMDFHSGAIDADGKGYWADRYVETDCADAAYPCSLAPEDQPLETIFNCELVHVREGEVVWRWSALDHVPDAMLETAVGTGIYAEYEPYHCNSVRYEEAEDTVYVSMRHQSSVLAIDPGTGAIDWTFGNYAGPEALAIEDPDNLLGDGQVLSGNHDFWPLGGNRFSVFDNRTTLGKPARFVVFSVADGTATIENVVEDPDGQQSRCTGSARPLDASEAFWVVSWGCSFSGVSVVSADGRSVATLTLDWEAAVERDLLTQPATDQADLGHTVSYQAVVGRPGLIG